ncbi:MAG: hypothetical protein AAF942_01360 [Pseudomonadota bacterium]
MRDVRIYRETRWGSLATGLALTLVVAIAALIVTRETGWSSLWATIGFLVWTTVMALPIHLCFRGFAASRRQEAWLFAWAPDRLYLRFRSFHNFRFDPDTPSIVEIPRRDVASIRSFTETLETRDGDGNWKTPRTLRGLQLDLKQSSHLQKLADRLRDEANRRDARRSRVNHYPVTTRGDAIVRIELRRADDILKTMAPYYGTAVHMDLPLVRFDTMSPEQQQDHILDLALAGHKIDAIHAAREVNGGSLADAKRFVEELAAR